jgi:hypothetical protein
MKYLFKGPDGSEWQTVSDSPLSYEGTWACYIERVAPKNNRGIAKELGGYFWGEPGRASVGFEKLLDIIDDKIGTALKGKI